MSNDPERPWDAWEEPAAQPDDEPAPVDPSASELLPPDALGYSEPAPVEAGSGPIAEPPPPSSHFPDFVETPTYTPIVSDGSPGGEAVAAAASSDMAAQRFAVWKDEIIAWCRTLVSAAVYATLIVTFGFQVARVEGLSMAPTLDNKDRLIVNKLAYRLGPPRRGDIVMLYYPANPDKSFVKRVIAEENDTIKIEDGRVFVNNVPMADDFVPSEYRSHEYRAAEVVREGYYFVMGDHRNNSSDSRHWGEVPKKYIIGKVQLRWWPIPTARLF